MAIDRKWNALVHTCKEIEAFLRLHNETEWSRTFSHLGQHANEARDSESRREVLIQVRALFGGMGSFNDLVIDRFGEISKSDNQELDDLRDALYEIVVRNIRGNGRRTPSFWFRRAKAKGRESISGGTSLFDMIEEFSEILTEHGRPEWADLFRKKAKELGTASTSSEKREIYEGLIQYVSGGSGSLTDLVLHRNGKPLKKENGHFDYLLRGILGAAHQGLADIDDHEGWPPVGP
ncbi:DUF6966 domain-containing protein [Paeniglutamicibacter sp. MACA_103]|uniref:DUF6966 domain-containing protein n=1 Tax=Paeniglutamicibacter sp. MACA_103 TaxID=3377337 RepID=UPI003893B381